MSIFGKGKGPKPRRKGTLKRELAAVYDEMAKCEDKSSAAYKELTLRSLVLNQELCARKQASRVPEGFKIGLTGLIMAGGLYAAYKNDTDDNPSFLKETQRTIQGFIGRVVKF